MHPLTLVPSMRDLTLCCHGFVLDEGALQVGHSGMDPRLGSVVLPTPALAYPFCFR